MHFCICCYLLVLCHECMCACISHGALVEIGRKLANVRSLPVPRGSGVLNSSQAWQAAGVLNHWGELKALVVIFKLWSKRFLSLLP